MLVPISHNHYYHHQCHQGTLCFEGFLCKNVTKQSPSLLQQLMSNVVFTFPMDGVTKKLIVTKPRNDDEPSNPNNWVAVTIHRDYNHCRDTLEQGGEYLIHTVRVRQILHTEYGILKKIPNRNIRAKELTPMTLTLFLSTGLNINRLLTVSFRIECSRTVSTYCTEYSYFVSTNKKLTKTFVNQ